MRGGQILWGQVALVLAIVVATTWAATQWTAWRLGFQPQLGAPWFEVAGWPIYHPPLFFGGGIVTTRMRLPFSSKVR